jgi:putative phage-type endonuclease
MGSENGAASVTEAQTISTPGQETDEWIAARIGKLTASRMVAVIGRKKNGEWLEARENYMIELMAERWTGMAIDSYLSQAMLWGIETEPAARKAYEQAIGEEVTKTGFIDHPKIPMCGASPDGLVGYDGLVEIKCPETKTHIGYLMERAVPEKYLPQMHWQLACSGRRWCDFVSFDPRMPVGLKLFRVRLERDERQIIAYENDAKAFLSAMAFTMSKIESGHMESSDL